MRVFPPNGCRVLPGIFLLSLGTISAQEIGVTSPTTVRLKTINGIVEQVRYSRNPDHYFVRQAFFDPKTEEVARFTYATTAATIPEAEQFLAQIKPANADSAYFALRLYDIFWDTKARHWTKMPKEFAYNSESTVNDQSVFFASHPLGERRERDVKSIKEPYRVSGRAGGTPGEYRFFVSADGLIARLEYWKENTLTFLTTTRVVRDFPPIPTPTDTKMFDKFSKLNVNDNGMIGARVTTAGDALIIAEVYPGSPAAEAGMTEGEQVLTVNGRTPAKPTQEGFRDSLKGPPPVQISTRTPTGGTKDYAVGKTLVIHSPPVMTSPVPSY